MKSLIIFAAFLIFAVKSESCGNLNQSANQWPWTVSIFSNASNMVLCQGSIISNKHILTAGHCLQHKNLSTVLVYPGFVSHRWTDNHQMVWQVEEINLHPDMKLTSRGRFINGGFVASMAMHADLAIATLKHEIQFNDIITSVCLPIDESIDNIEIHGSYSGWNRNEKKVESLNSTIEPIGDAEIFEVAVDEKRVDFVTGTGFYSRLNSSWMIIGLMTMRENENQNGNEMNKFISIHKYVNWITNITQSTSTSASSFIGNVETSTSSDSLPTKSSEFSSNGNTSLLSSVNPLELESSKEGGSTLLTTKIISTTSSPTNQNSSALNNEESTATEGSTSNSGLSQTTAIEFTSKPSVEISDNPTCQDGIPRKLCVTHIRRKGSNSTTEANKSKLTPDSTTEPNKSTITPDPTPRITEKPETSISASSSVVPDTTTSQVSTAIATNLQSTKSSSTETSTTSLEKDTTARTLKSTETAQPSSIDSAATTENSILSQGNPISTPIKTSSTPQNLISMTEVKVENSTTSISFKTDMPKSASTENEIAIKAQSINDKIQELNVINTTTELNLNIDSVTEIPKIIASNLQAVNNRSLVPKLPEGRSLNDFGNNVSQAIEGLSTIANRLPSIILTTLATTTRNPDEEDIITTTSLPSLNLSLNNTSEASPSIMNSTESNDNSTTTISSEDIVIAGIKLTPAIVITGVCIASLLILFIVFGLLALSKPIADPH